MEGGSVYWPDPTTPAPAGFERLAWGASPEACGLAVHPAQHDARAALRWLARPVPAGATCLGARLVAIDLGFASGRLELVRLRIDGTPSAASLREAGFTYADEHFWVYDGDELHVEVDQLDGTITLSEPP